MTMVAENAVIYVEQSDLSAEITKSELAWEKVLIQMFMSPQKTTTGFLSQKSITYVFVSFWPPH